MFWRPSGIGAALPQNIQRFSYGGAQRPAGTPAPPYQVRPTPPPAPPPAVDNPAQNPQVPPSQGSQGSRYTRRFNGIGLPDMPTNTPPGQQLRGWFDQFLGGLRGGDFNFGHGGLNTFFRGLMQRNQPSQWRGRGRNRR